MIAPEDSGGATLTGNPDLLGQALTSDRDAFLGFLAKRLGNQADADNMLQECCNPVLAR